MGTVGISFGSPTAGTGFDVSTTVSQIVANLQNVESPWKSQLSNYQAQDTAISSLGSLLSTLSNDVSAFTDFQGVLSGKQGSVSDPDVMAITSASSSAVAGTYSIVVNSLATTSSGYLDNVVGSTDQLSGSISIGVGSGAPVTVSVDPNNNTLAGLATSINNANIGVTASVITDANGSRLSLASGTSGSDGNLAVSSSITDTTTGASLNYNLAQNGQDGSITVNGSEQVSVSSNTVSTVIPGVTFQLLAPSPITAGTPETIQVQILNDSSTVVSGVSQLVSDYNAVISAINAQETNTSSGTPQPLFASPTLTLLQQQLLGAINTSAPTGYLDDLPTANANDTLTGSISIAVGTGSSTTFDISSLPAADQTLSGLASAINAANLGVTASVVNDSTGSHLSFNSELYGAAGKLTVTSSLADPTTGATLNYNSQGDVNNLAQLGISVNNDGTLSLDASSLTSELNTDYSGVVAFFQNANSWGTDFSTTLDNLGTSNTSGTLALALSSDSSIESSLNSDISNEDLVISTEQVSLTLELTSANEILQSIPANLNNVDELYSAITGYNAPNLG